MAITTFNAENGSNGTTLTTSNVPASIVLIGPTATATFSNDTAAHGNLSYKFTSPSTVPNVARIVPSASNTKMAISFYITVASTPSGTLGHGFIFYIRSSGTNAGVLANIQWTAHNQLRIVSGAVDIVISKQNLPKKANTYSQTFSNQ